MIIKATIRGTNTNTELCLPFNRGFIDDMTVTTVGTKIQDRWILKASYEAVS